MNSSPAPKGASPARPKKHLVRQLEVGRKVMRKYQEALRKLAS